VCHVCMWTRGYTGGKGARLDTAQACPEPAQKRSGSTQQNATASTETTQHQEKD
jgi:hypothetical protein